MFKLLEFNNLFFKMNDKSRLTLMLRLIHDGKNMNIMNETDDLYCMQYMHAWHIHIISAMSIYVSVSERLWLACYCKIYSDNVTKRNTGYVIVFAESFHARVFALVHSISIVSCFLVLLVEITSLKYLGYVEKKRR